MTDVACLSLCIDARLAKQGADDYVQSALLVNRASRNMVAGSEEVVQGFRIMNAAAAPAAAAVRDY